MIQRKFQDKNEFKKLDRIEEQKTISYLHDLIEKMARGKLEGPVAKYLYPEIPWKECERRAAIWFPVLLEGPWVIIPFYDVSIILIQPLSASDLKRRYGLTSDEILEGWKKGVLYPVSISPFVSYSDKKYEHMHLLIEKGIPQLRTAPFVALYLVTTGLYQGGKLSRLFDAYRREGEKMGFSGKDERYYAELYAILCSFGFRERLLFVHDFFIRLKFEEPDIDIHSILKTWSAHAYFFCISQPTIGSPSIGAKEYVEGILLRPLMEAELQGNVFLTEAAEKIYDLVGLSAPAKPEDVDIDWIIEAHKHAADLRRSYAEFQTRVHEFQVEEAKDQLEAVQKAADEFNKSVPRLDAVEFLAYYGLSISAAALTTAALGPLSALIPSAGYMAAMREARQRGWLDGALAKFLSKLNIGPFAWVHTWKLQRKVKRTRTTT